MSSRLLLYVSFVVTVLLLGAFHLRLARMAADAVRPWGRRWELWTRGFSIALFLFLDLPLVHVLLIYKFYNPPLLDSMMRSIAAPFLILHVNVMILGGGWVLFRYVYRPIRARLSRGRGGKGTGGAAAGKDSMTIPSSHVHTGMQMKTLVASEGRGPILFGRRKFIRSAALAATGYIASSTTLSAMGSTHEHQVEKVVMKIPGLPPAFRGTTVAMVTDIHSSVFMTREQMSRYVAEVMKLKADMIFVTGDFVNSKVQEVYPFAEAFSGLSAPMGVYGVTGNHDYYAGQIETVAREVEQTGMKLLRNENIVLQKGNDKLWLMGMDDADIYDIRSYLADGRSRKGTIENLTSGIPEGGTKLFLCHKPYPFEEYSALGVDAMFSGHTHGGQVVLAHLDNINLSFASLASKYVAGLYKSRTNRRSQLYVSRGIGTVGIPVRLNCPPEITYFVLV